MAGNLNAKMKALLFEISISALTVDHIFVNFRKWVWSFHRRGNISVAGIHVCVQQFGFLGMKT